MSEKKKGVVPRLRFPEFRNAGPWEVKRLGAVARLINERVDDKDYVLLSVTSGVGLVPQKEKFGREIAGKQKKNYWVIRRFDFAYNKSATKEYPQGYVALYTGNKPAGVPNSIFTCFRPDLDLVAPNYLNHLFSANFHGRWLAKVITVGARAHGSLNVDSSDVLNIPLPIPKVAEQQKIADCLSSLDELIQLQAQKLDALKAHKKGLMQQLFPREGETTPRLRFPEFRNAGPWEVKKLEEVLEEHGEKSNGTEEIYSVSVHKGLVNQIEHLGRSFAAQNTDHYNRVFPGDIVYTKSPTGDFPYGIIKQNKSGRTVIVSPLYGVFRPQNYAIGVLLDAFFESPSRARIFLEPLVQKGAKNTINISNSRFLSGALPLPQDPKEQQKIADCLSSLDELIQLQAHKLDALRAHKKGLMQQLFPQEVK